MKLVVFGATGGVGSQIVARSLAARHSVTALARKPSALTLQDPCLHVIRGDVFEPTTLVPAIAGQEVVVPALGVTHSANTTLFSAGISNILQAMREAGVRRLICISASALDLKSGPLLQRWFAKPLLWRLFKDAYTDMARMEVIVQDSDMDWTIIRPPRLTNGARTGKYEVTVGKGLSHGWFLSRADLADYIVGHLNDPATYRAFVNIAY